MNDIRCASRADVSDTSYAASSARVAYNVLRRVTVGISFGEEDKQELTSIRREIGGRAIEQRNEEIIQNGDGRI